MHFKERRNIWLYKAVVGKEESGRILFRVINRAGTEILPFRYQLINLLDSFYLVESSADLFGVFDSDGKEILPVQFEKIEWSNFLFQVKLNGKSGLYTLDGMPILPIEYEELERKSSTGYRAVKEGIEYCIKIQM